MPVNPVRNVLVLIADQHAFNVAGWMGNSWVHTPNLDALAASGTVFERAYTPSPVCVPARQSLLTGRYPHAHGAYGNSQPMHATERTFAHLAKEAGFATGAIGKMHFIGEDQHQGFDTRWDIEDYYALEPEASGDAASGMAAPGCYGKYVPGLEEGSSAGGPNPMRTRDGNYDAGPSPFPAERHVEAYTTRNAVQFLEEHRGERFALWCSHFKPHAPYTPPVEDWERYADLPLPVPGLDPDERATFPTHLQRFLDTTGVGEMDEAGMRRCIAGYYGNVTYLDRQIGEVLGALDSLGLRDETLIVYTSDHGDMVGAHGLLAKMNFFEESWHVPMIVSHPAYRGDRASRTRVLACLTDLMPTLAEATGLVAPATVHGHSLLPVVVGECDAVRDHVYSELASPRGTHTGVFDGRWKLASYVDKEQLFDLDTDPGETRDVREAYPEEASRLRALMERDAALT
jgi:choline-sulfatase